MGGVCNCMRAADQREREEAAYCNGSPTTESSPGKGALKEACCQTSESCMASMGDMGMSASGVGTDAPEIHRDCWLRKLLASSGDKHAIITEHLHPVEFAAEFQMKKSDFDKLPEWKKIDLKKKKLLH
ncbi:hypothetical protein B566_EDAN016164 [Ephemera danica]|nr:hypothetical protein B566_EDAN016164 [Ephemera danica]